MEDLAVNSYIVLIDREWVSYVALVVENVPTNAGDTRDVAGSLGREDPLEVGTETHFSNFAWSIPWTEEPDEL